MLRVQYERFGGPEVLRFENVIQKEPVQDEIRIRVEAASVNPMDWKIRSGTMRMMTGAKFPRGIGTDFAGVVEAVGPRVSRFKIGDQVFGAMGLKEPGSFGETVITPEGSAVPKPPSLTYEQAASLPVVGLTAWLALVQTANVKAGQSIFINGCLGGVGRAAVQIASIFGVQVTGSCSADEVSEARALGASVALDYHELDLERLRGHFDVVFDTAGTLSPKQCRTLLNDRGVALHINITPWKLLQILITPKNKVIFTKVDRKVLGELGAAAAQGKLSILVGKTVPMSRAISAITDLEKTGNIKGKLVIFPNVT